MVGLVRVSGPHPDDCGVLQVCCQGPETVFGVRVVVDGEPGAAQHVVTVGGTCVGIIFF